MPKAIVTELICWLIRFYDRLYWLSRFDELHDCV
jgi:hypothetical protein